MARIPFQERLWCSPAEMGQVLGIGKTKVFEKIHNGDIVSKLEGRRRLVHVPSLIARYGLEGTRPGAVESVGNARSVRGIAVGCRPTAVPIKDAETPIQHKPALVPRS